MTSAMAATILAVCSVIALTINKFDSTSALQLPALEQQMYARTRTVKVMALSAGV